MIVFYLFSTILGKNSSSYRSTCSVNTNKRTNVRVRKVMLLRMCPKIPILNFVIIDLCKFILNYIREFLSDRSTFIDLFPYCCSKILNPLCGPNL